jgi:hypothetical protein
MFRKTYSLSRQMLAATALALGASSVALADDNSMSRWGGESYAAFNENKPIVSNSPSTFRQTNPRGLPHSVYEEWSADGRAWPLPNPSDAVAYAAFKAPSTFHQDNPHGLSIQQYAAYSSDTPFWQYPVQQQDQSVASTDATSGSKYVDNKSSGSGIAGLFGFLHAGRTPSAK